VQSPTYKTLEKTTRDSMGQAISASTARELTNMMVETVQSGTATAAQIPGVAVAGKTGTAQSAGDRPPYAWFVSFAPADNPVVAVAVLVEASSYPREEIAGGRLGAPIAKSVMEAVISDE
jgi:penicillin-binding protein A